MIILLTISLLVNVGVLAAVVPGILQDSAGMDAAFGPDTPARRILTSIYIAILVLSAVGLAMLALGWQQQVATLAVGLLAVQIVYKFLTAGIVGMDNPVVGANIPIAILHCVTLATLLRSG
ncbi:hypothetical protein [Yoonia sp. 208BN28-4]|uniref:hypothetical protein n=1 Tax=Yoonia sp. 208BN28-4 TaxID=3126505 RepID=UPI0030A3C0FD